MNIAMRAAAVVCAAGLVAAVGCDMTDRDRGSQHGTAYATPEVHILSVLHANNIKEIQVGRMAQEFGASDEVRRQGQRLVRDHTESDAKVLEVAREEGIALMSPPEVDAMMKRERDRMGGTAPDPVRALEGLRGPAFDQQFTAVTVAGHADMIRRVQNAQNNVRNERVRDLLQETLASLEDHRRMAMDDPD